MRYKLEWHVLQGNLSTLNCNSSIRKTQPIIVEPSTLTYILKYFNLVLVISSMVETVIKEVVEAKYKANKTIVFLVYCECISTSVLCKYVNEQFAPTDLKEWWFGW